MTLDPQSLALLESFRKAGGTAIDDVDMATARRDYDTLFAQLGGPVPDTVSIRMETVPLADHPLPLRLYRPRAVTGPAPVLLFFHGGGWSMGGLPCYDAPLSHLAADSGFILASVGYRLAPENPFPAPLDDALNSTRWALSQIGLHGGNPARLLIGGDSAGATLAASVCQLLSPAEQRPKGQVLFYPVLTLADGDARLVSRQTNGNGDYFLSREGIAWAKGNYLSDPSLAFLPAVSPLLAPDLRGLPPALLVTGGYDPLHDEAALYAARLRDAGGQAEHLTYPGTFHGFMSFCGALDVGRQAIREVADRMQRMV
ncbi:alpha/beta hydrolase [Niveispirillum sp.]|uniref:alpha/beta hydrolase n=1 Tax=Niveispirillum sp. TaxID=1917217 RepID=UPI001B415558|nr:alpha/beta hydrolase [Niveispirillum sp.]MBP7338498.1 alpha/beta hydrolase [Niveispirillum sp.]